MSVPDPELGKATLVYKTHGDETASVTVDNEFLVYFQDHWQVKTQEDESGNDVVRRIPRENVVYVERSVEEFEDRVDALVNRAKKRLPVDM